MAANISKSVNQFCGEAHTQCQEKQFEKLRHVFLAPSGIEPAFRRNAKSKSSSRVYIYLYTNHHSRLIEDVVESLRHVGRVSVVVVKIAMFTVAGLGLVEERLERIVWYLGNGTK